MNWKALVLVLLTMIALPTSALAETTVPGHSKSRLDQDDNGYPDAGVIVNGHYTSVYAYDDSNWYWDLGDGRVLGTVTSVDQLDPATLTVCDYVVNYRGEFNNDPFLDSGWIKNQINCRGYDDNGQYNSTIVHRSDPRFTGDPARDVGWGPDWEYQVNTMSGKGNLVRPYRPVGS